MLEQNDVYKIASLINVHTSCVCSIEYCKIMLKGLKLIMLMWILKLEDAIISF